MNKTVIIGGVAGGASAAARLRRLDEDREIIILERGDYISYANCGLPYYIGDVIKEREALLLQTPEDMKAKFNVDVRVGNNVVAIDKENNKVVVEKKDGAKYEESYDELIISTGSSPLVPPIPGIDTEGIYTLWTVNDTDKIRGIVDNTMPKTAAVIGGGFIGLEMAENLHERGIEVSLVEAQNQVMAPIDFEMAQLLAENMDMNGVELFLGDGVNSFAKEGDQIEITLASERKITVDMVILSIGVRPNSQIAKEAGLEINKRGGIVVNNAMQTSHHNIWAVGDVIEVDNFVTKEKTMIPLAGPANKQGRMVANNLYAKALGKDLEEYEGSMGTSVAKVFDLTVAATGINEKTLIAMGKERGKDYLTATIKQNSHAGYYPMALPMTLKLVFNKEGKIFGAQIVGQEGVDKRLDVIATTMRVGGTIEDLKKLELAYAPPYSSAKDPVNMLGFVAENMLSGMVELISPRDAKAKFEAGELNILDVREDMERLMWSLDGAINIPLGELRQRANEIPKDKPVAIMCAVGVRAYNGLRILKANGLDNVMVVEGGVAFYVSSNFEKKEMVSKNMNNNKPNVDHKDLGEIKIVDCCGLQCPGPIMKVNETLNSMDNGDVVRVSATDMGFANDVESWCKRTGNTFLGMEKRGLENVVTIQKGCQGPNCNVEHKDMVSLNDKGKISPEALPQGKTMIVFDGDLDKVLASFIIANGAAAMGRPVTMFFTFWGLNALRKSNKVSVKKKFIEKMFGAMMPRGTGKLKLSNMNMGGMGTKMMKAVMKEKNVASLEELMETAMNNGVKLVACTMSMDVMGITKEELIDGVEYAGVATYLGDAEMANVNLFI